MIRPRFIAALALSAAALSTAAAQEPLPETYYLRAYWSEQLPFVPQAALASEGNLHIARVLDDGRLEVASSSLGAIGLAIPDEKNPPVLDDEVPIWTTRRTDAQAAADPTKAHLFAVGDAIVLIEGETASLFPAPTADTPTTAPLALAGQGEAPPMERIDAICQSETSMLAVGSRGGETIVATRALEGGPWRAAAPGIGDRRGMGVLPSFDNVLLMAGRVEQPGGPAYPLDVSRAPVGADGVLNRWERIVQRIPKGIGACAAARTNNILGVIGERHLSLTNDELSTQTLAFAIERPGNMLSTWTLAQVENVPALSGALLVGNEEANQFLILGGMNAVTRTPNQIVWGIPMPSQGMYLARRPKVKRPVFPMKDEVHVADYTAGRKRAAAATSFHVVLVLDDSEDSKFIEERLLFKRESRAILTGIVVSTPRTEDERATVNELLTPTGYPYAALLDASGKVLSTHAGPLDVDGLIQLLEPIFNGAEP